MKKHKITIILLSIFLCWQSWQSFFITKTHAATGLKVSIIDNDLSFDIFSNAKTVGDLLSEQKIILSDHDLIYPSREEKIYSGTHIIIERSKKIIIKEGGNTNQVYTFASTIEEAIWDTKNIELDEDDITVPDRHAPVKDGMSIVVTHVLIKEEVKNVDIAFKTVTNEDDSLGWRIKKITQKGILGTKEVKYRVVYNNGKEISRKILESNVIKDPSDEIVTQGTFVKIGKTYTGAASWYAFRGGLFAANPWLPMGSYVRVTNKDNGKSVIVQINDRGPFGNGRIIDLDKVAFSQIASIGAGVADVKVEAITN